MEAVPKLPMLSFELKISPVCPDFAQPFKRLITKYYGEDGDMYDREIMQLETCRTNACRAPRDFTGCSLLKRYYAQIYSLYNRLVVFEGAVGVQCIWADIYTGQTNIGDLDFELACILYNIGALHAELGATDQRQTAEEMKVSCTHFQCAAWAFQELLEDGRLHRSGDMSADLLSFFVQVTLAQAQECILEKSMLDSRKASIVAKVAAQVVAFYRSALSLLTQGAMNTGAGERSSLVEVVGSKLFKEWKKFVDFKLAYYGSLAHLYMGNLAEEGQKMGERVAWYESADARLKEAAKLAKQLDNAHPVEVTEATTFVGDVIAAKLGNAKKENDFIYHEKVPPVESLTEITGAPLVKGIPFSITDPEIAGVDIFARLVPIEAHETASLYSARKDEILRSIRVEIENRNADLAAYLSSLQLERDRLRAPKEDAIPDELIDICAELSLTPGAVAEVERTLTRLDSIAEQTERAIEEAKAALAEEEAREEEDGGGGRLPAGHRRPPSLILVELRKELAKHEETHQKAVESNRSLWENFDQHKDDITVMTSSSAAKIASILPSLKTLPVDEATIAEMERLFDKVEEMRSQRESLEERLLKEMDAADGQVLKLVLATPKSEIEAVFERELRKYDQTVELLRANMAAQENILRALTAANARYAETRKAIIEPPHLVPAAAAVSSSLAYATPSSIPPAAAVYQQPHQVPPTSSGPAYGQVPTSYGMMNNNFSSPAANVAVGGGCGVLQQTWQSPSPQHHLPPAPAQSQSPYMQQPPTSGVHHLQQPQQQQQQQQPPHLAQPQYGLQPQPTQQPYYYGSGSNSSAYPSQPQQQPQGMMTSIGNPTSVYQQQQQPSVAAIPSSLSAQVAGLSLGSQNSHSMQPPTSPYVSTTYNGLPTVVNGGGGGGAPVGAYMQQQTQLPQPQQQQQQYITPQAQPQAQLPPPAQSAAASVVQALEMESKKGWPVMMPTSVAGAENNKTNTSSTLPSSAVPAAAVSGVSNGHAASAAAAAAATSSVPSVNGGASSEGGAGSASKDIVDGGGEPKDLLSQFDPLFS
ncbi:PREDICTED: tyrosine-protein phosphatase non-receptor type 23-like [Rhagoletis zephyria]|uniref:tyrosine-protein phosphatase non-receptor type 23-like n=1 Tax=Rhagoletis zephyria TaxID=28612 RepID=UPI0008113D7B|nr:PREDICTED: tyrosine-protein phosphatase non-receptor type 23-like [Rhagoletis zephyria]